MNWTKLNKRTRLFHIVGNPLSAYFTAAFLATASSPYSSGTVSFSEENIAGVYTEAEVCQSCYDGFLPSYGDRTATHTHLR